MSYAPRLPKQRGLGSSGKEANRVSIADFCQEVVYYWYGIMHAKIKHYQEKTVAQVSQLRDLRVVGVLFFLIVLLLISWSGVKAIDTNYGLQKQIARLQQQNAVQKLTDNNL